MTFGARTGTLTFGELVQTELEAMIRLEHSNIVMLKKYTNIYNSIPNIHVPTNANISKCIRDISRYIRKIDKIDTKYQAAAGPAQAQGRTALRGPGLGPGQLPLGIFYLSCI